jgi:hypothetical protein
MEEYPSPIHDRSYVDTAGVGWRIRGAEHDRTDRRWRRVERLLRDSDVPVLHVYLRDLVEVSAADREPLLVRMREGDADFRVAEFKSADGRSMVVVEETC